MFTGIITDLGTISKMEKGEKTIRLVIETSYNTSKIAIGASISCDGCCLTVVNKKKKLVEFDVSPETLDKTNFGSKNVGDKINLEQALKLGEELGGHLVTGHVDTLIEVSDIKEIEGNWQVSFKVPSDYSKYIAAKGSVTLNGVSLTVNKIEGNIFEVNIIPHTLEKTNLKFLKIGSKVNFEIDLLARYVEKLINNKS